jgi:hypothetical protein
MMPIYWMRRKWESVLTADKRDIMMPQGLYFLVVDNTLLCSAASEEKLSVHYKISEKY